MDHLDTTTETPLPSTLDGVGVAVGSGHFVQNHRLGVAIDTPMGRSPRLRISRYYWDLEPPIAVDFVRDLKFGELEVATKKAHFAEQNVRYILVKDGYDGENAEAALNAQVPEGETPAVTAGMPLLGPRKRRG